MPALLYGQTGIFARTTSAFHDWPWRAIIGLVALGAVGFHLAFAHAALAWLVVLLPFALIGLARLPRWRMPFYGGIVLGLLCYAPRLAFFWTIFKAAAIPLWMILSVWLGLFGALLWLVGRASLPGQSVLL